MKEIARKNLNLDDKQLNKELVKNMIIFRYLTDRAKQVGFNISLDSHHINHSNSKVNIKPKFT